MLFKKDIFHEIWIQGTSFCSNEKLWGEKSHIQATWEDWKFYNTKSAHPGTLDSFFYYLRSYFRHHNEINTFHLSSRSFLLKIISRYLMALVNCTFFIFHCLPGIPSTGWTPLIQTLKSEMIQNLKWILGEECSTQTTQTSGPKHLRKRILNLY